MFYMKNIKLTTQKMIAEFVDVCSKYRSDINIYDGRNIIDAKSLLGVFAISQGKEVKVNIVSYDKNEIIDFLKDIRKFEV